MLTTTTRVFRTIRLPSCWLELPLTSPPPWIQKYTGSRAPGRAPAGRCTLRYRQSSVSERGPLVLARAGQRLPYDTASRTPDQGCAGRGGRHRSGPTGGRAYGTPRKLSTAPALAPRRSPVWTRASGAPPPGRAEAFDAHSTGSTSTVRATSASRGILVTGFSSSQRIVTVACSGSVRDEEPTQTARLPVPSTHACAAVSQCSSCRSATAIVTVRDWPGARCTFW